MIFPTPPLRRTEDFQRNAHGCMVYTERGETAAVSCGTSHASAVSTPSTASTASFLIFPPLEGCFGL